MADPITYDPSYSFSGWQASNPSKPLPAQHVDDELANISDAINGHVGAIKDIRRSDGALKNGIVTIDSVDPAFMLSLSGIVGDEILQQAQQAADDAEISASSASVSALSAEASAGSASASAAGAAVSADAASTSAGLASVSATDAAQSAVSAAESAMAAEAGPGVIDIIHCGAVAGDSDAYAAVNDAAFAEAIALLERGWTLLVPSVGMPFVVGHKIKITKGYTRIAGFGFVKASSTFTDDFLWEHDTTAEGSPSTWFRLPIWIDALNLDCNYKTRGLYERNVDHQNSRNVRVERAYGTSIRIDKMRECVLYSPMIVEAKGRTAFTNPDRWSPAISYVAGNKARAINDDWSGATTYAMGDISEYGGKRYIARLASTNMQPDVSIAYWQLIPFEDYECVVPHTNKNPFTYNLNNATPANGYWKKVYQDEAAFEIVDDLLNNGDRTNSSHIYSPIIRDCANMCLLRIDNNKSALGVGTISIYGGHIHDIPQGQGTYPPELAGAEMTPMRRCVEIGFSNVIGIFGTQIRASDADSSIGILLGDGSATKRITFVSFEDGSISSGGNGAVGVLFMPSVVSQTFKFKTRFAVGNNGTSPLNVLDPKNVLKELVSQGRLVNIVPRASGNQYVDEYIIPATYPVTNPISFKRDTDAFRLFILQVLTSGGARLQFGDGAADVDVQLFRDTADRLTMGNGDSFRVEGTWNGGHLIMGSTHYWTDGSGRLRSKGSAPASDTDGTVVGSQS